MIKRLFVVVTIISLLTNSSICQINQYGIPFIRNYNPKEYKSHNQNWAIVQDKRGVMYFGNGNGVLEYDGTNWRLIEVSNLSTVWSLATDSNGIVYVGAAQEFGFLFPDSTGLLKYHSLITELDTADQQFSVVRKTHVSDKGVYFITSNAIYRYNFPLEIPKASLPNKEKLLRNKFRIWPAETSFRNSMISNNQLIVYQDDKGFMKLDKDSLKLFFNEKIFSEQHTKPSLILPYEDNKNLVVTKSDDIFIFRTAHNVVDIQIVKPINLDYKEHVKQNQVYCGTYISENQVILGTIHNGIVFFNSSGKITNVFNKETQLQDDQIYDVNTDNIGSLWAALNDGVSKIESSSPLRQWNESNGLQGIVNDVVRFNNTMFAATNTGVYYIENQKNGINKFVPVKEINSQSLCFLKYFDKKSNKDVLFVGTNNGIYIIRDKTGTKFLATDAVYNLRQSVKFPERIFIGITSGLNMLIVKDLNYPVTYNIEDIQNSIWYTCYDDDKNLWAVSEYNGVYKINEPENPTYVIQSSDFKVKNYDLNSGLPTMERNSLWNTSRGLFLATTKGLYIYNKQNDKFVKYTSFNNGLNQDNRYVNIISEDEKKNWWITKISGEIEEIEFIKFLDNNKLTLEQLPFKRLPKATILKIYPDIDDILWIASTDGLFTYNQNNKKNYTIPYATLIRKVVAGPDSILFNGTFYSNDGKIEIVTHQNTLQIPEIDYKDNNILFQFCAPYFEDESSLLFSCQLEGNSKGWSDWSHKKEKEYTNLYEGDYTFHVKAKNIYGIESQVATYTFRVMAPWYRTYLAFAIYFILIILIVIGIVKIYTRRLVLEKERLEVLVTERTAEVVRQKEEIVVKNVYLEKQKEEILAQNRALQLQKEQIEEQAHELEIKNKEIEKQRDIATTQRDEIALRKKEITDSIHYAKRIQSALLTPEKLFQEAEKEYFILFKPRDIVSGDFYMMRRIDDFLIVVTADCTGHGVPGAFMSMLGMAFLNEIFTKLKVMKPSLILNKLRNTVKTSLRQTGKEGEAKDGMDIALYIIDLTTSKLEFAGAYNPMYIVRNKQLIELKPDKMPIGIFISEKDSFTDTEIQLEPGDCLYTFSDGYSDQFGGPLGKKFMVKKFKDRLIEICDQPMKTQGELLNTTIEEYKSHISKRGEAHYQVDDILVIGVKY